MAGQLLTTREVAAELAMSEDWVRDNAAELGGIRMGRSSRSQLRFEPEEIAAYKQRQRLERIAAEPQKPQRAGRRAAPAGVELFRPRPGPRPAPIGVELLPLPPSVRTRGSH
jgi:hypothetical protein